MYKKAITYTDFDGVQKTETFYFNLTKAEMIEMELRAGGMQEMLQRITDAQDSYQVAEVIKDIISRSYGEKTPDGKRFIKNQEIMNSNCLISSLFYVDFSQNIISQMCRYVYFTIIFLAKK